MFENKERLVNCDIGDHQFSMIFLNLKQQQRQFNTKKPLGETLTINFEVGKANFKIVNFFQKNINTCQKTK